MKLGKEEIQKLVLGVLLFIGVIYFYFDSLIGPLSKRMISVQKSIDSLAPAISSAKAQIRKTAEVEAAAPKAKAAIAQVEEMIPEGSPVAWVPTRLADFFKKSGVEKTTTRMNNGEIVDKGLAGFRKITWSVDFPKIDFVPFAAAISQFENEEPLFEISTLQIDSGANEEVDAQHAQITVRNLVKK